MTYEEDDMEFNLDLLLNYRPENIENAYHKKSKIKINNSFSMDSFNLLTQK
jgi:hypothetical protein